MSKLRLDPAQGALQAKLGPETIAVQLDGGASRYRRTQLGAAAMVSVEWVLLAAQYDYLMAFYRYHTAHGSLPFTLDLILNKAAIAEYTAHFVPGSIELAAVRGTAFIVAAQLEILPLAESGAADLATITAYEASL